MKHIAALLFAFIALSASIPSAFAAEKIVTIGTAGLTGVYYPAGGAICRLVNRGRKDTGIHCAVESTGGSINNLEEIRKGELELGIVQSDLLYNAYDGTGVFSDAGPDKKLRILFSLHSEPFTVVARKAAKINTFDDLKGKRIDMGEPGSGMRATMEELMKRKGWNKRTFTAIAFKTDDQVKALCSGKVDAIIFAGGHPNGQIHNITSACNTKLVDVSGPVIDAMIKEHPYFTVATIPPGMYPGNPQEVKTFGMKAMLVSSSDLDDEIAYQIVKSVLDNLDNFKTLHPVFATLDAKGMTKGTDLAPMHSGALKYFKEKGLVD